MRCRSCHANFEINELAEKLGDDADEFFANVPLDRI